MSVLIVGASGAVGSRVVEGLVRSGVEVRATSRSPERLATPEGVQVFRADLEDPASFEAALVGVERVFLYADLTDPAAFAGMLAGARVRHAVVLSSSSVLAPGADEDFNGGRFIRVERAVEGAGLAATFLRPGAFSSNTSRWSWGIKAAGTVPLPYPEAVQAPVHEADIADVAVLALSDDGLVGHHPVLTGPEALTLRRQVQQIGEEIGRELTVAEQSVPEAEAMLGRHLPDVWVQQIMKDWRRAVGAEPEVSEEYRRLTGRAPRSFRQWVADNRDTFL